MLGHSVTPLPLWFWVSPTHRKDARAPDVPRLPPTLGSRKLTVGSVQRPIDQRAWERSGFRRDKMWKRKEVRCEYMDRGLVMASGPCPLGIETESTPLTLRRP